MEIRPFAYLEQKFFMLLKIPLRMRSQEAAVFIGLSPAQGIEFVIAHDGEGRPLRASFARLDLAHAHGDMKNITLPWAAIDRVACHRLRQHHRRSSSSGCTQT
jgi:hypothetical protein